MTEDAVCLENDQTSVPCNIVNFAVCLCELTWTLDLVGNECNGQSVFRFCEVPPSSKSLVRYVM